MKDITFTYPEKPPKVYFTRDVNYLETGFMSIKAKYPDGANFILLNPQGKTIMTVAGLHEFFSFHLYRFTWEDTEGTYTAQLRKGVNVVASDTTEVKHMPQCEEGFQECIHGDLWKCVGEAMKLVEENSKACVRDGFYNTNESAPSVLRLDVGTKDIMITKDGYEDLILKNLKVIKGKTTSVAGIMIPLIKGYISCNSTPSGAGIWIKEVWSPFHAVATKTEITKSEFITEIQKLGKIKLEKIPFSSASFKTWVQSPLFGVNIRYVIVSNHHPRHITISNMGVRNPPTDVKDISFTDSSLGSSNWEKETFNRVEALEAIGKLPFVGFGFTSKVTPATMAFSPKTYAVKFKLDGYKEKVVSGVVVKEGKTTSVSITLEKTAASPPPVTPPPTPPTPPGVAKFKLSEIVENHLPEWITGYACGECRGYWEYKCPAGYKCTECRSEPIGSHGCCSRCAVVFVKCESVVAPPPPVTPPPQPPPPTRSYINCSTTPSSARIWLKKH